MKNNKGITLIALVITIIVLLILAGVSIATLTGENGILTQASKAGEKTKKAEAEEQVKVEILGSYDNQGKLNLSILNDNLINNLKDIEYNGAKLSQENKIEELPVVVKCNGYDVVISETEISLENKVKPGEEVEKTEKYNYTDGIKFATIPEGFKVSKEEDEQKIDKGLVIQDTEGNEFVWIPVQDITQMAKKMTEKDGQQDANGNEYYEGKLYGFTSPTDNDEINREKHLFEEPAYAPGEVRDDNTTYGKLFTEENLHEDYNSMIASVKKYKGFYVGRYEMSQEYASKKGEISATAIDEETKYWYGLYKKAKNYYLKEDNIKTVVGNMMWGSQYDRMLNWMKENDIDVTKTEPIPEATRNIGSTTGTEEKDKLNNVYDLLGNNWEWTMELSRLLTFPCRIERGGCRVEEFLKYCYPSYRRLLSSENTNNIHGCRISLYIK